MKSQRHSPKGLRNAKFRFCRNYVCRSGSVEDMIRPAQYVQNRRVVLLSSTGNGFSPLLRNAAEPDLNLLVDYAPTTVRPWQSANGSDFSDRASPFRKEFCVEKDEVDRLREILARSADRRRPGVWQFVRKFGALLWVWRRLRPRRGVSGKD